MPFLAPIDRGGRIRTGDFSLPKRARYQAAPRPAGNDRTAAGRTRAPAPRDVQTRFVTLVKRIEIRWRDLDSYGHVNQAVYLTYAEEVLDDWFQVKLDPSRSTRKPKPEPL